MPKTREEIEALKANWVNDACWDIEITEGFEDHKEELLAYRKEMEAIWDSERKLKKFCPIFSLADEGFNRECFGEPCAWWDEVCNQCSIRRLASLVDVAEVAYPVQMIRMK